MRESNHMTLENMLRDMSKKKNTYEYHINPIFSSTTNVSNMFFPQGPSGILFSGMIGVTLKKQSESKTRLVSSVPNDL